MNYEEKYKYALDLAKQVYDATISEQQKENISIIFPELRESEDETVREKIIATIHLYYGEPLEDEAKQMLVWLEKQRQKPAEWSHEDDVMVHDILGCLPTKTRPEFNQRRIDWLKSLKERYTWKPTEEQMKALHDMNLTGNISYVGQGQTLIELYKDLKKL